MTENDIGPEYQYAKVIEEAVNVTNGLSFAKKLRENDRDAWEAFMRGEMHDKMIELITATLSYVQTNAPEILVSLADEVKEEGGDTS